MILKTSEFLRERFRQISSSPSRLEPGPETIIGRKTLLVITRRNVRVFCFHSDGARAIRIL